MGTHEEWAAVATEVRRAADPLHSPALKRLYDLAREDGKAALRGFHQLEEEDRQDLVLDGLLKALREIVGAADPRAFFATVVVNSARSAVRAQKAHREKHKEITRMEQAREAAPDVEGTRLRSLELDRALSRLSQRDHDIVVAALSDGDRDEVARLHGLTRNGVDQIVSRFQRRLRQEDL